MHWLWHHYRLHQPSTLSRLHNTRGDHPPVWLQHRLPCLPGDGGCGQLTLQQGLHWVQAGHHQLGLIQEKVEHLGQSDWVWQRLPCSTGYKFTLTSPKRINILLHLFRDVYSISLETKARAQWKLSTLTSQQTVMLVISQVLKHWLWSYQWW